MSNEKFLQKTLGGFIAGQFYSESYIFITFSTVYFITAK